MTTRYGSIIAALILTAAALPGCGKSTQTTAKDLGSDVGAAARSAGDAAGDAAAKTGEYVSDATITTRVKAAIIIEMGLELTHVDVETMRGVVTLSGDVKTQANSDGAAAIAQVVDGVREVRNNLVVKATG